MTVASRLARVEASLLPTELVVRWLAEAHAYDDLGSYSAALLDADPSALPMDRLAREAKASATERNRGRPRAEGERAVRAAIIAAVFRVQLVLRINVLAGDFVDREVLVQAALSAHLGLAVEGGASPKAERASLGVVRCRDLLLGRVTELHALEAARGQVEARFLDGVSALFPAGRRAWEEQRTQTETMAVVALRLAELDGVRSAGRCRSRRCSRRPARGRPRRAGPVKGLRRTRRRPAGRGRRDPLAAPEAR